ncbi:MAG: M48 family metallopeptidase [Elusimicrobia bacterium]|nr:M48 family metallopeptidase [Candidatus Obscuribacterium magneticum]
MMKNRKPFVYLLFALSACATVPYSHRKQFNIISPQEEIRLGEDAYTEVRKKTPLSKNMEWQRRIWEVGGRIAEAAEQPTYKWEFNVLEGKEVNAWCLPGGKVAFYEAIIPVCETNGGLAVVMGHEVAHALAHHGAERMSQSFGENIAAELLSAGLGNATPEKRDAILQVFGIGANVGVLLPFSRTHESEADHIGLILMAKAGYNPHAAVSFWERMKTMAGGEKPPEFLSTHPSDDRRINQIKKWLPEAMSYYKK